MAEDRNQWMRTFEEPIEVELDDSKEGPLKEGPLKESPYELRNLANDPAHQDTVK